ncbi:TonB-dependent receptor [Parasphingorhabdus sp.]|uniref:TonB-dependent receptor n=1 Tax=Parasphingorhabdus sp. TaxID=2709688 RepID=UPI0032EC54EC
MLNLRVAKLCSVAVLMVPVAVSAQTTSQPESDGPDNSQLEEIVVTAQRRSESLQDVPIAVTALSNAELTAANIEGQITLPKITPNLSFNATSTLVAAYIRGVGTQFALPGLESSVATYMDDVYLPRSTAGIFSFSDIERIEVLKGPQGSLYGRNATGGAIRIITRDPGPNFEASGALTYGSYDRLALDGVVNVPLSDKIWVRFAGRHDQSDGFAKNLMPGAGNTFDRNEEIVTGKLLVNATDALTIKFSGDYSNKRDGEGNAFFNLFGAPEQIGIAFGGCGSTGFYNGCNRVDTINRVETYGVSGRLDYEFNDTVISSITAFRSIDEDNCADNDATGIPLVHTCGRPYTRQFTQELLLSHDGDGPLNYLLGVYYLREKTGYPIAASGIGITGQIAPLGLGFANPALLGSGFVRVRSFAPFAQIDYEISDQFAVTIGARYTSERKKLIENFAAIGEVGADGFPTDPVVRSPFGSCANPPAQLCESPTSVVKFNRLTPKFTLSYRPNDDLLLYATFSRGFKSGGFNLPSFNAVDEVEPETLDSYELGWKYQAGAVRFNGAAFYYNYKDLQVQFVNATGGARLDNAANAKVFGLEADATWLATSALEIGAGIGYLNGEYRNYQGDRFVSNSQSPACAAAILTPSPLDDAACVGLSQINGDLSGNRLTNAPRFTGFLRAQYTADIGEAGSLLFSGVANYRSTAFFDPANDFPDRKRALLSGRVSYTTANERFTLSLIGENLTSKKYDVSQVPLPLGGFRIPGPPRQVYVQAGFKF